MNPNIINLDTALGRRQAMLLKQDRAADRRHNTVEIVAATAWATITIALFTTVSRAWMIANPSTFIGG